MAKKKNGSAAPAADAGDGSAATETPKTRTRTVRAKNWAVAERAIVELIKRNQDGSIVTKLAGVDETPQPDTHETNVMSVLMDGFASELDAKKYIGDNKLVGTYEIIILWDSVTTSLVQRVVFTK